MEGLTPWMDLHVPMNYGGTAHTVMLIGTMPLATLEEIYQMLAQDAPEVDGVDVSVIYSDKDTVYLAVVCLTQDAENAGRSIEKPWICKTVPDMGQRACGSEGGAGTNMSGVQRAHSGN